MTTSKIEDNKNNSLNEAAERAAKKVKNTKKSISSDVIKNEDEIIASENKKEEFIFTDESDFNDDKLKESLKKEKEENENKINNGSLTIDAIISKFNPKVNKSYIDSKIMTIYNEAQSFRAFKISSSNGNIDYETLDKEIMEFVEAKCLKLSNDWLDANPELVSIVIDKENAKNLEFSDAEKEKISIAKNIRLVLVEDEKLKSIKIKHIDKNINKVSLVNNLGNSLSFNSIALPTMCDYTKFKGSNTLQLAQNALNIDTESIIESLERKASFIYDRFISSTLLKKYDESGKIILSYNDFVNKFPYYDINTAIYSIYCASSPESYSTNMKCNACDGEFTYEIIANKMLNTSNYPDNVKERLNNIIINKDKYDVLEKMNTNIMSSTRFQSSKSNNIYQFSIPSISRAKEVFTHLSEDTDEQDYIVQLTLFTEVIYVYDKENDEYIEITDIDDIIEILSNINEFDFNLLINQIKNYIYIPQFLREYECPNCHRKINISYSINELVFLRAQEISAEIK